MQILSLNFKPVVSRIEEEAMLLSVFFYCICAFLCAVAVSNYPFVVKVMSLVGFPPKNPVDHSGLFLWQRGTIYINWTPGSGRICMSYFTLDCYERLGAKLAEFYPSISPSVFRLWKISLALAYFELAIRFEEKEGLLVD